jgi:phosphopantetheinyl transferase
MMDQTMEVVTLPVGRCANPLCHKEGEEARLIRVPERRLRFIQTRSALRMLLSDACDNAVHPEEWRFNRAPGGKPCLEYDPGFPVLEFSISHSGSFTAIAVMNGESVGIDIESIRSSRYAIIPSLVALCPEESAVLANAPEAERWRRFIRIWTAKEAYVKFLGTGIDLDFTGIRVDLARGRIACCRQEQGEMPIGALVTESFIVDDNELMVSHTIAENSIYRPRVYLLRHRAGEENASIITAQGCC